MVALEVFFLKLKLFILTGIAGGIFALKLQKKAGVDSPASDLAVIRKMCPELISIDDLACTVEQQQSEYQCEERYCLYDTDNDEVVSGTFTCCSESIRCSSCASALEEC